MYIIDIHINEENRRQYDNVFYYRSNPIKMNFGKDYKFFISSECFKYARNK